MISIPSVVRGWLLRVRLPVSLLAAWAAFSVVLAGVLIWLIAAGDAEPEDAPPAFLAAQTPMPPSAKPQPAARRNGAAGAVGEAARAAVEPKPEPPAPEPARPTPQPAPAQPAPQVALAPAPDPALVEQSAFGPLPRIGADGREPWQVYARPFDTSDPRPRVAIVISGLGRSAAATEAAIQGLPGAVTLAFLPYGQNLQHLINLARAAGHEVLLNLPMEPIDYPINDPGPNTLLTALSIEQNQNRLNWVLGRVTGYVGVANHMGSRFTASEEAMEPVIDTLKSRGLLFLDSREASRSIGATLATKREVPRAIVDRFVDRREASRAVIDAHLSEVERKANEEGVALAMGQHYPVTIERLRVWIATLEEKGIALSPISAVVDLQEDR